MSLLSARETAYQTIRSRIITMELKPGDPLNDRELAEELGISRTPMREALLMLNLARMVGAEPWLWPWQRHRLCAGGAAGHRSAPPPAQQSHPQGIPRPAHHAGVYRRAGAGDLWLYRTFRYPVMQTGRKGYHG